MLAADCVVLTQMISKLSRKNYDWASKKVDKLFDIAVLSKSMPKDFSILSMKIKYHLDGIENFQNSLKSIEDQLHQMFDATEFPEKVRRIDLLDQMPGIGFMTAFTLIAEIGDFDMFKSPKAFTALFGLDPSVNQSGKLLVTETRFLSVAHGLDVVNCLQ